MKGIIILSTFVLLLIKCYGLETESTSTSTSASSSSLISSDPTTGVTTSIAETTNLESTSTTSDTANSGHSEDPERSTSAESSSTAFTTKCSSSAESEEKREVDDSTEIDFEYGPPIYLTDSRDNVRSKGSKGLDSLNKRSTENREENEKLTTEEAQVDERLKTPTEEPSSPNIALLPWSVLHRIARQTDNEEFGESSEPEEGPEDTLDSSESQQDGVPAASASFNTEEKLSDSVESDQGSESSSGSSNFDLNREGRNARNSKEVLNGAESRYGRIYSPWYRPGFFPERYWPWHRRHYYHPFFPYPVFPGR